MRDEMEIIRLADETARVRNEHKISVTSACYVVFNREGIPESEQSNLCSAVTSELGYRGGKKSGRVRRQKRKTTRLSSQEMRVIISEAKWQLTLDDARRHEYFLLSTHPDP